MNEQNQLDESTFWLTMRQGFLIIVAAIEKRLGIEPSTSDLRKQHREALIHGDAEGNRRDS